jgi:hypothetical protein
MPFDGEEDDDWGELAQKNSAKNSRPMEKASVATGKVKETMLPKTAPRGLTRVYTVRSGLPSGRTPCSMLCAMVAKAPLEMKMPHKLMQARRESSGKGKREREREWEWELLFAILSAQFLQF